MKTLQVWAVVLTLGVLAFTARCAQGAYLQLEPDKSFNQENPQGPTPHPPITCVPSGFATASGSVSPNGQTGSVSDSVRAGLVGDCPSNNVADIAASDATFTVQPNAGETAGEPLVFCFQADIAQSVSAAGFSPQSTVGDSAFPVTGPAAIIVNPTGTPQIVFSYGPRTLVNNEPPVSLQQSGQFVAHVGDEIELTLGTGAEVQASGGGTAQASASGLLSITVGACPAPEKAPALSSTGMAALVAILSILGLALLRRELRSPTKS